MNDLAAKVFKYRSYTPIPFVILMFIFQEATPLTLGVGFAIALLGEFFRFWGVSYAGSETRTTGDVGGTYLVISGGFGHVRNPLYVGNILMYMGIGVMSYSLFPYLQLAALVFFYLQYTVIINQEEKYLLKTFGTDFEKYCKSVSRFFPRITPYKNESIPQPTLDIKAALRSERRTLQAFTLIITLLLIVYWVSR